MAEMALSRTFEKNKRKILSTKVDLTPMVDLGFLLLTFFVFSSVMTVPSTLHLIQPDDRQTNSPTNVKESGALTLLLGQNHQIYWYTGLLQKNNTNWNTANMQNIRTIITNKKKATNADDFVIIIKPSDQSDYNDLVQILNEMKISMVDRYSISDMEPSEKEHLLISKN